MFLTVLDEAAMSARNPAEDPSIQGGRYITIVRKLSGHCESVIATSGLPRDNDNSFKTRFGVDSEVGGGVPFGSGLRSTKLSRHGRERMSEMKVLYVHTGLLISNSVTPLPKLSNRIGFLCSLSRDSSTWINLRDLKLTKHRRMRSSIPGSLQ